MRLGIIGLSYAGKTTVFEALTKNIAGPGAKEESRIGSIKVPDARVDKLSDMYNPKKTTFAQVEYLLPGIGSQHKDKMQHLANQVRDCDALVHVLRNFTIPGLEAPTPFEDFVKLDEELRLSDFVVAEKRMERLQLDKQKGRKMDPEEMNLIQGCLERLENEEPIRKNPELAASKALRGFAFLSAKPVFALFNNNDEDDNPPAFPESGFEEEYLVVRGKIEHEIAQMTDEEAKEFMEEFEIKASTTDRLIRKSYELLGLISFFTVGEDEVRAWTIKKDTIALDAAEVIHSDIKKGFIRAEVLSYDDLMDAGSHAEARKKGTVRLEGKTYVVQDGDIINFRFNV